MKRLALVVLLLSLLLVTSSAEASFVIRPSYYQMTTDQKYMLVMVGDMDCCPQTDKVIKGVYPSSGLYPKDDATKPLWTIEKYAYKREAFLSTDGNILAAITYPHTRSQESRLEFYKAGVVQRGYQLSDLVGNPGTSQAAYDTPVYYTWYNTISLDAAERRLSFEGRGGERFVFDFNTGEIIEGQPLKDHIMLWWFFGGLGLFGLIVAFVFIRSRKNRKV